MSHSRVMVRAFPQPVVHGVEREHGSFPLLVRGVRRIQHRKTEDHRAELEGALSETIAVKAPVAVSISPAVARKVRRRVFVVDVQEERDRRRECQSIMTFECLR